MRRAALLFLLPLVLTACGGSDGGSTACEQQYWDGQIGICLPAGWSVVSRETLEERGLPQEVIAAFQADRAVSGQFPTLTVTREDLRNPVTSTDYSAASIRSVSVLPEYNLIDSRDLTVAGDAVQLHIFSAQPLPEEPQRRFYQASMVHGNAGYTFTALTPLSVSNTLEGQIETMMNAITFTNPEVNGEQSDE